MADAPDLVRVYTKRPRKPIVIEFAGSPKSGKSSCIGSLDIFLRRNGFRTRVLTERASICPISGKFDPKFNIWTACSSLLGLIEVLDKEARTLDIVLIDRGLFDALCWFEWQYQSNILPKEDYDNFNDFFTTSKFRLMTDLVYLFVDSGPGDGAVGHWGAFAFRLISAI